MIEVILMERIERLGKLGELVKVKPGFARNYLLPRQKALRATKANIALFEKQRAVLEAQNAKQRDDAEAMAKIIADTNLIIVRQASESGQLYGSVTARDIAEAAEAAGKKIERSQVEIISPIKAIGLFQVRVKLHPDVQVNIAVNIARTEEEGKVQQQRAAALESKNQAADATATVAETDAT